MLYGAIFPAIHSKFPRKNGFYIRKEPAVGHISGFRTDPGNCLDLGRMVMKLLCYGDSNTYGYDPRDFFGRCYYNPWPLLLAENANWIVRNLGENGREIPRSPVRFGENCDLLIIMLGTNDLLQGNTVEAVTKRMEAFLTGLDQEKSKILLIAPPPMRLGQWVPTAGLIEASKELSLTYQDLAQRLGVRFVNAGGWNVPLAFDGVHFTESGHRAFAEGLQKYLTNEGMADKPI